jgi:hypothetical protein
MFRRAMYFLAATFALTGIARAQTPTDVLAFFRTAAENLSDDNASAFLDHFDHSIPAYETIRSEIEGLLAAYDVGSSIEIVSDEGDDQKRMLQLDWLLIATEKGAVNSTQQTRRQVVKCRIERQGKQWRITALEPVDFFRY